MKYIYRTYLSLLYFSLLTILPAFGGSCIQFETIFPIEMVFQIVLFSLFIRIDRGIIWIGSCDGMNIFDGTDIYLYTPISSSKPHLSGNLINQIIESEKDILWVQTNYGLNRLDTKQQTSQSFTEFKGQYFMANNKDDMLLF